MFRQKKRVGKIASFAAFAVLASAACEKEYGYTPKKEGVEIIQRGPISTASANPDEKKAPKAKKGSSTKSGAKKSSAKEPEKKGCPEEMAHVKTSDVNFCIDRWEIHLVNDAGEVHPKDKVPGDVKGWKAVSAPGVYPQGYLSQEKAKEVCRAAGKVLCSLKESKTACKGPGGTKFPYGATFQEGICHVGQKYTVENERVVLPERPHILDVIDPPPANALLGQYKAHHAARTRVFYDPRAAQEPGYLMKTGSFPKCVVVWDGKEVYDLVGNLSEWTRTTRGNTPSFIGDGHSGTDRAGCDRSPFAHTPKWYDYSLGARCCKKP